MRKLINSTGLESFSYKPLRAPKHKGDTEYRLFREKKKKKKIKTKKKKIKNKKKKKKKRLIIKKFRIKNNK
ncbi:hypothetical protein ID0481_10670 [Helicobacter pylori]